MTAEREPVRDDELAARVRAIEFPEAAGLGLRIVDRHRSRSTPRRPHFGTRSRLAALATAVAALLLATAVAAPNGREALAAAPLLGPVAQSLLRVAGLEAAGQRLEPLRGESSASGETISLTGGYADNQETVLILHVAPARSPDLPITLLADGAALPLTRPVVSHTAQGDVVLLFGPIANPDPKGSKLTLRITRLGPILSPAGSPPGVIDEVLGDWTLHFELRVDLSAGVAAPPPGRLGELAVTFTASVVGTEVQVTAQLHGASIGQLEDLPSDADAAKGSTATPGPRRWSFELLDLSGRPVLARRLALANGATPRDFVFTGVWSVPGPGTYVLVSSWLGNSLVRRIAVR
jgi:hypothetical protein